MPVAFCVLAAAGRVGWEEVRDALQGDAAHYAFSFPGLVSSLLKRSHFTIQRLYCAPTPQLWGVKIVPNPPKMKTGSKCCFFPCQQSENGPLVKHFCVCVCVGLCVCLVYRGYSCTAPYCNGWYCQSCVKCNGQPLLAVHFDFREKKVASPLHSFYLTDINQISCNYRKTLIEYTHTAQEETCVYGSTKYIHTY